MPALRLPGLSLAARRRYIGPMDPGTLRRELDWRLQNALTASVPVIKRSIRTVDRVTHNFSAEQNARFRQLATRYPVTAWASHCTAKEFVLNLYVLDILDHHFPGPPPGGPGLDIGASSWSYLPALVAALNCQMDGVEIDAHRRYWTLATRRAHAEYVCRHYPGCRFIPGSLLDLDGMYTCITWFLPFVTPGALRAWRLPSRFFQPERLLQHAWSRLSPGGVMFVVNQGQREAAAQHALFSAHGIPAESAGEISSVFYRFSQPRYGSIALKSGNP